MTRPILLLDVDGPLNPYASKATKRPEGFHTHRMRPKGWELGKPLRVWLNPEHGKKLKALGYEIVWATAWGKDANIWIGPHVGLPKLEYIDWGPHDPDHTDRKLLWKTQQVASYMQKHHPGVDFIWVDDEIRDVDIDYLRNYLPVHIEGFKINPTTGITDKDFADMSKWKDAREDSKYAK